MVFNKRYSYLHDPPIPNPNHDDIISELPTFYENRRSFYRSRNKETPKLPITRTDIQLEGKWTQFFIADDGNADKIITFTTSHNLTNLYQQTSSMETALSILHQINLLNSTHCTQWSTISCTHSRSSDLIRTMKYNVRNMKYQYYTQTNKH
jgi:hypothetical protein